jgi:FdrA protein
MPRKEVIMNRLNQFFKENIKVINIGIPSFAEDLTKQGIINIHVDWRPPAGGNKKVQALLEKVSLWQSKVKGEVNE